MSTINSIGSNKPIQVAFGGTGASTLTSHGVLLGNTTSTIGATAEGTTGSCLMGTTGANPSYTGSPSFSGSVTAGTSVTASSGNVVITSGNLTLPNTSSTVGQIKFGGDIIMHNYGPAADNNLFVGKGSGNQSFTTAQYCAGFGLNTLNALSGGSGQNLAFGPSCLKKLTTGAYNLATGLAAGTNLLTGQYNVILGGYVGGGAYAGSAYTSSESSNIIIQNPGVVSESNTIRIGVSGSGSAQQNKAFIAGIYGVTPGATLNVALINSSDQLGSVANLGVAQGGTGAGTFTSHGVIYGNTTSALGVTAEGATGTVLIGTTSAAPSFSASPTVTTMNATTFDTNVTAAGLTLSGTTLAADGTDADINLTFTPKGTGTLSSVAVFGKTVGVSGVPVVVDNAGLFGTIVSSSKFKENIADMNNESLLALQLRPVVFNYKSDPDKRKQYGLIAEEVDKILPELVAYDKSGDPFAVRYNDLPVMLLNELQKALKRIEALEKKLSKLPGSM